jgi:hypothetical protein
MGTHRQFVLSCRTDRRGCRGALRCVQGRLAESLDNILAAIADPVERSWGAATHDRDFWNPATRSAVCFNPAGQILFIQCHFDGLDDLGL